MTRPSEAAGLVRFTRTEIDPERRANVDAAKARLQAEASPVRILRTELSLTQGELAELLGTTQGNVSKLERKDVDLATVRRIVEARGGRLRVVAEFDDLTVDLLPA